MTKIDMSEVIQLHEDLKSKTQKVLPSINKTKAELNKFVEMKSFNGTGAEATKNYISTAHNDLIEVYNNLITDLNANFQYSIEQFLSTVDNDKSCIINSEYVQEIKTKVSNSKNTVCSNVNSINKEISSISDITTASSIKLDSFKSDETDFKKIIEDMLENFEDFLSISQNEVSQSQDFMDVLNSMQGQVQQISNVPNGIKNFDKGTSEKFKSWIKTYKDIKKDAKQLKNLYGAIRHDYFVKTGRIVKEATKDGKTFRLLVKDPKALPKVISKIKNSEGVPWYKVWKKYEIKPLRYRGQKYRSLGSVVDGRLTKTGEEYYKFWGMNVPKAVKETKSLGKKLKGKAKDFINGWKNFGELRPLQKFMKVGGAALAVASTGLDAYDNYNAATKQGLTGKKRVLSTTVNTGIDFGVAVAAGAAGAKAGALVGMYAGPLGSVAGATVGFVAGVLVSGAINHFATPVKNALKNGVNYVIKNGVTKTAKNISKKVGDNVKKVTNSVKSFAKGLGNMINVGKWSFGS